MSLTVPQLRDLYLYGLEPDRPLHAEEREREFDNLIHEIRAHAVAEFMVGADIARDSQP